MIVENGISAQATIKDARAGRLKTYNVKEVSAMLGRAQSVIVTRARRAQIRPLTQTGAWFFTLDDIQKIKQITPKVKKSNLRIIAKETGYSVAKVRSLASRLRLRFLTDYEKIIKAVELHKTREYTILGILKRL